MCIRDRFPEVVDLVSTIPKANTRFGPGTTVAPFKSASHRVVGNDTADIIITIPDPTFASNTTRRDAVNGCSRLSAQMDRRLPAKGTQRLRHPLQRPLRAPRRRKTPRPGPHRRNLRLRTWLQDRRWGRWLGRRLVQKPLRLGVQG